MEDSIKKLRARGVPEDRIDEYQAAFSLFDVDSAGYITKVCVRPPLLCRRACLCRHRMWAARDAAAAVASQDKLAFVLNTNFGERGRCRAGVACACACAPP